MTPAASVSGLYFAHPQARYFTVGRLGEDQIAAYARRKGPVDRSGRTLADVEPGLRTGALLIESVITGRFLSFAERLTRSRWGSMGRILISVR